jgi:hypothetical protein
MAIPLNIVKEPLYEGASLTPKLKWKNHPKVVLVFFARPGAQVS